MQKHMQKLNNLRNRYVHPLLEVEPFEDANESINLLCKIIDSFVQKEKERDSSTR